MPCPAAVGGQRSLNHDVTAGYNGVFTHNTGPQQPSRITMCQNKHANHNTVKTIQSSMNTTTTTLQTPPCSVIFLRYLAESTLQNSSYDSMFSRGASRFFAVYMLEKVQIENPEDCVKKKIIRYVSSNNYNLFKLCPLSAQLMARAHTA